MKADEYVVRFQAEGSTIEAAAKVAWDMIVEVQKIGKARRVQSDEGLFSVLNEMSDKWRAFVRRAGSCCDEQMLRDDGFEAMLERRMPEIHSAWMMSRKKTM